MIQSSYDWIIRTGTLRISGFAARGRAFDAAPLPFADNGGTSMHEISMKSGVPCLPGGRP
ncbi:MULTISPECIES: hypothetical protein [Burkholderia cepacia complex]|uniref:hypothetical protein n=1 Tax=Burkholderia cepacia complex TaxID=87882 RepID=UPI0013DDB03C|nr:MULTISPECIES: hypothetical protein [Burkholderia cepacia complex]